MGKETFSSLNRSTTIEHMEQEHFDLLVIGGGITGSGIALDAASRGLKVALIERKDFASGTSSRSGKLIHGGLKYLQKFDFPVVKETGRERDIVYNNARHLVYPITMNFPLIKKESYNKLTLKAGLFLYDRLAGVRKEERHKLLGKRKTMEQEPLFNNKTVKGSGIYVEYRTDDSRLTMSVAKTAVDKGAYVLNYAEMTDFLQDEHNQVKGVVAKDHIGERIFTIHASNIVNAAGPWVDKVRKKDRPITGKYMLHAKGIHIVFDRPSLPVQSSIYFQHKGRMIAVIPRGNRTFVGSTETRYEDDMDSIRVEQKEVDYLLSCLRDMFPTLKLTSEDVTSSWAGIRPLIGKDEDAPSELSRHDEIFESDSGLVTIAGGKLTGYRKMAERVMQYLEKRNKQKPAASSTSKIKLAGGDFHSQEELENLIKALSNQYSSLNLSEDEIHSYVMRYGTGTQLLLEQIKANQGSFADEEQRDIAAEVNYTIHHEMAASLVDFYDRRTSYLLFDLEKVKRTLPTAAAEMKQILQWNEARTEQEIATLKKLMDQALAFIKDKR